MSNANEHTDNIYIAHFKFKDPVNATYIITFWDQWPCSDFWLELMQDFDFRLGIQTKVQFWPLHNQKTGFQQQIFQ